MGDPHQRIVGGPGSSLLPRPPRVFSSHDKWLKDIATPTIDPEEALVEVHLEAGVLEVDGSQLDPTHPHVHRVIIGGVEPCALGVCSHHLPLTTTQNIYARNKSCMV